MVCLARPISAPSHSWKPMAQLGTSCMMNGPMNVSHGSSMWFSRLRRMVSLRGNNFTTQKSWHSPAPKLGRSVSCPGHSAGEILPGPQVRQVLQDSSHDENVREWFKGQGHVLQRFRRQRGSALADGGRTPKRDSSSSWCIHPVVPATGLSPVGTVQRTDFRPCRGRIPFPSPFLRLPYPVRGALPG